MEGCFELKIFPEIDRTHSVVKCVKKMELVSELSGVKWFDGVIPLQITKCEFALYQ